MWPDDMSKKLQRAITQLEPLYYRTVDPQHRTLSTAQVDAVLVRATQANAKFAYDYKLSATP